MVEFLGTRILTVITDHYMKVKKKKNLNHKLCRVLLQNSKLNTSKVVDTKEFTYILYLLIYKK